MSYVHDSVMAVFQKHFECEDEQLKILFELFLEELHGYSHRNADALNHDEKVYHSVQEMDIHLSKKEKEKSGVKFRVVAFLRTDVEEEEEETYETREEAEEAKEHDEFLQPEHIFKIEEV